MRKSTLLYSLFTQFLKEKNKLVLGATGIPLIREGSMKILVQSLSESQIALFFKHLYFYTSLSSSFSHKEIYVGNDSSICPWCLFYGSREQHCSLMDEDSKGYCMYGHIHGGCSSNPDSQYRDILKKLTTTIVGESKEICILNIPGMCTLMRKYGIAYMNWCKSSFVVNTKEPYEDTKMKLNFLSLLYGYMVEKNKIVYKNTNKEKYLINPKDFWEVMIDFKEKDAFNFFYELHNGLLQNIITDFYICPHCIIYYRDGICDACPYEKKYKRCSREEGDSRWKTIIKKYGVISEMKGIKPFLKKYDILAQRVNTLNEKKDSP